MMYNKYHFKEFTQCTASVSLASFYYLNQLLWATDRVQATKSK